MIAAAVLAGGAARRMGGVDKAMIKVCDFTLLDRVLRVVIEICDPVVVVGPTRTSLFSPPATFIQESVPGGGPVPAVGAALEKVTQGKSLIEGDVLVVVAVDLPLLSPEMIDRLVAALDEAGTDGQPFAAAAAAADSHLRPNPVLAAYRMSAFPSEFLAHRPASSLLPGRLRTVDLGANSRVGVNDQSDLIRVRAAASRGGKGSRIQSPAPEE